MNTESPVPLRRRSLRFRCSALAWAVAVAIGLLGDVLGERDCPHHEADGHAAHAVHHGDHGTHGDLAAHDSEHGHEGHADPCLCLGSCQAGSAVALGEFPAQGLGTEVARTPAGCVRPSGDNLPGRAPFVLPFAHGPPHVV